MKLEQYFNEDNRTEETLVSQLHGIIKSLIDYQAKEQDNEANISLLKELVLKYSDNEKELFELNQLKNKFLGIAAHDLRNPLVSIRGFSEMLVGGDIGSLNDDQKEVLGIIRTVSQQMLDLINNLLDVAVIESGKLSLQLAHGCLRTLLEERINLIKKTGEKKQTTIKTVISDIPETVFDSGRIGQVIDNLLSNAIKYSPAGSIVDVNLDLRDDEAVISVKDNGPGLSDEDQAKLFGTFQKLSSVPTGGEKSTGLGLSIVKKIVEAHNGRVEVVSRPGYGSTFSFIIPLEKTSE